MSRPILPNSQQTDNKIADIRFQIKFLQAIYGDCLNRWPRKYEDEYYRLARELRQLEFGGQR